MWPELVDDLALFQDGYLVGNAEHFFQLVADKDNGLVLGRHLPHGGKELVCLDRSEHGCGFIKNKQFAFAEEQLEDFHLLFFSHGQLVDGSIKVKANAIAVGKLCHLFEQRATPEPEAPALAQDDIFQHAHVFHQFEVLVDHANAAVDRLFRAAQHHLLAAKEDAAAVWLELPGQKRHQGGFACAVFTQKGKNLTAPDCQADVVVGPHPAK